MTLRPKEVSSLSSEQSLRKGPSFSKKMCRKNGLGMEKLSSIATFEPLQNFNLGVLILLRSCTIQYSSARDAYSHPAGPSITQKRQSLVNVALLRACSRTPTDIEKNFAHQNCLLALKRDRNQDYTVSN